MRVLRRLWALLRGQAPLFYLPNYWRSPILWLAWRDMDRMLAEWDKEAHDYPDIEALRRASNERLMAIYGGDLTVDEGEE